MTPQPVASSDPQPVDPRAIGNLKHGLTGARLYFQTKEDAAAYEELKTKLLKELAPETEIMRDLAHQIVTDRYRLTFAAELETKIYRSAVVHNQDKPVPMVEAETWLKDGEGIARIELYSSRIQRRWEKNFALYRQLQAERKAAIQVAVEEAAQLAELAESKGEPYVEAEAPVEALTPAEATAPAGPTVPAAAIAPAEAQPSAEPGAPSAALREFGFSTEEVARLVTRYRSLKEARALASATNPAPKTAQKALRRAA